MAPGRKLTPEDNLIAHGLVDLSPACGVVEPGSALSDDMNFFLI